MRTWLLLVTTATFAVIVLIPSEGAGASLCAFDEGTGVVTVAPAPLSPPYVIERSGDAIAVNGEACGDATVTTTETIEIVEADAIPVVVSLAGGPFAPGASGEADGSPEIEFDFVGYSPDVTFAGSSGDEHLTAGGTPDPEDLSLNLNAAEPTQDVDVTFEIPPPDLTIQLGGGDDTYSETGIGEVALPLVAAAPTVRGGAGTDVMELAYGTHRSYLGGSGSDTLSFAGLLAVCVPITRDGEGSIAVEASPCAGGDFVFSGFERFIGHAGTDRLGGDGGQDRIFTRGGDDVLYASDGRDVLDGGTGRDLGDWSSTGRVRVDLAEGSARVEGTWLQSVVGVEDLEGSAKNDVLAGNARENDISGGDGDDTILGRGGIDVLWGDGGFDTCDAGLPGGGETVFCEVI